MDEKLQRIDEIVKRTNASYENAKMALEQASGDVLEAIILIETQNKSSKHCDAKSKGEEIMEEIKRIINMGNATKITVKKNGETIINLPITAGAVGAFLAPFLALAGVTAALLTQCTVEILQADGKIIDVNEKVEKGMENVKSTMDDVKNKMNKDNQDNQNNQQNQDNQDSQQNQDNQEL
jgi:uncharacterized protein DUF4342